jgi:hypothetical protein
MKKVLAVLLTVCMIASLGITAHAAASDYGWGALDVKRVIIADGVTTIPEGVFDGLNLQEVVVPASVKNIALGAFGDAKVLAVDPAAVVEAMAFDGATADSISQEEFDEMVAEVEENGMSSEGFVYDPETGTLLVKAFKKGTTKTPAGLGKYADWNETSGAGGGAGSAAASVWWIQIGESEWGFVKTYPNGTLEFGFLDLKADQHTAQYEDSEGFRPDGTVYEHVAVYDPIGYKFVDETVTWDEDGNLLNAVIYNETAEGVGEYHIYTYTYNPDGTVTELDQYQITYPNGRVERGQSTYTWSPNEFELMSPEFVPGPDSDLV